MVERAGLDEWSVLAFILVIGVEDVNGRSGRKCEYSYSVLLSVQVSSGLNQTFSHVKIIRGKIN